MNSEMQEKQYRWLVFWPSIFWSMEVHRAAFDLRLKTTNSRVPPRGQKMVALDGGLFLADGIQHVLQTLRQAQRRKAT